MLRIDLHQRGNLLAYKNLPTMTRMQWETGCSHGQREKKQSSRLLMCFRDSTYQGLEESEVPPVFQGSVPLWCFEANDTPERKRPNTPSGAPHTPPLHGTKRFYALILVVLTMFLPPPSRQKKHNVLKIHEAQLFLSPQPSNTMQ